MASSSAKKEQARSDYNKFLKYPSSTTGLTWAEKKWVWVPHKPEGFIAGEVLKEDPKESLLRLGTGEELKMPTEKTVPMNPPKFDDMCGIHAISVNHATSVLATGSSNPDDIALYRISDFAPFAILEGHHDWVFAVDFLSDSILASGSRDTSVSLWSVADSVEGDEEKDRIIIRKPLVMRKEHTNKVRDLKYFHRANAIASLSLDTTVKLWDASNLDVICTMQLGPTEELVCLAVDEASALVGVGSRNHIHLFDSRTGKLIRAIESRDENSGVRSLHFRYAYFTTGGGNGGINFFDLRAGRFLNVAPIRDLHCGSGWLDRDLTYLAHFSHAPVLNAIYTHCWSDRSHRLFTAGGPLMVLFVRSPLC